MKQDKKTAILNATLKLITERGFHDTPMSVVAEKAGVGAGTIYRYFKNKDALINELYSQLKENMGESMKDNDEANQPIRERFFNFWNNLYSHFINNPEEFLFLEQYANSPYISKLTKEENEKHYQYIIDIFADAMEQGSIKEMPIELATTLIYGNVASLVKLQLSRETPLSDKEVKIAVNASWDSIKNN